MLWLQTATFLMLFPVLLVVWVLCLSLFVHCLQFRCFPFPFVLSFDALRSVCLSVTTTLLLLLGLLCLLCCLVLFCFVCVCLLLSLMLLLVGCTGCLLLCVFVFKLVGALGNWLQIERNRKSRQQEGRGGRKRRAKQKEDSDTGRQRGGGEKWDCSAAAPCHCTLFRTLLLRLSIVYCGNQISMDKEDRDTDRHAKRRRGKKEQREERQTHKRAQNEHTERKKRKKTKTEHNHQTVNPTALTSSANNGFFSFGFPFLFFVGVLLSLVHCFVSGLLA